jgi:hypothetical protein
MPQINPQLKAVLHISFQHQIIRSYYLNGVYALVKYMKLFLK